MTSVIVDEFKKGLELGGVTVLHVADQSKWA